MNKQEMKTKLCLSNGVGVEVNNSICYFYEAFDNNFDDCIKRIYRHFSNGESLIFYTTKWARQLQFKEYMELYKKMVQFADEAEKEYEAHPEDTSKEKAFDDAYKRQFTYMTFLIEKYMLWAGLDFQTAKKHIITNQVHYSKFN